MKKLFYGWFITAGGTLGNALQGGFIFWSMGIYTSAFEDYFNTSRRNVTLIETFLSVGVNCISPLLGMWADKKSARDLVVLGAVCLGTGLIVISLANTLLHIWVVFLLLIPLGALGLGVLPSSVLISRWFKRRRGLAMGISLTGSSIGGALAPPLLTFLFMAYGWRTSLQIAGVFVIVLAFVFYRLLADYPEDLGLQQEGGEQDGGDIMNASDERDWLIRDIMRTKAFWLQTLITGSLLAVTLGLLANLSLHAKDLGFVGQQVAVLYSVISLCSFFGKIISGTLIDRFGIKPVGTLTIVIMISALLMYLTMFSYTGLVIASFFMGIAFGGVTPLWTNMVARGFGSKSVGRTLGIMNPLHIPITAPSAPIAGHISDTTGSYELVFILYIGFVLVAAGALFFLTAPTGREDSKQISVNPE